MSIDEETQGERWERVGGRYFLVDFAGIPNKRASRRDLHAFNLLSELFPGDGNIVQYARHEEIFLDFGENEVAKLTDEQIIELSRCGVRYDEDSLCMFT